MPEGVPYVTGESRMGGCPYCGAQVSLDESGDVVNHRGCPAEHVPAFVRDEHLGFKKLEHKLAHRKGVTNPKALAAWIGEKKYGKKGMEKRSKAGKARAKDEDSWPRGTKVTWHYRSAIGHGTIEGVHKKGSTHATTEYSIRETDHHPGEPAVVYHYGSALHKA